MADSITEMLDDPNASMAAIVMDRGPLGLIHEEFFDEYMKQANDRTGKPVFLVSNRQGTGIHPLAVEATNKGMPVLDGMHSFLAGVRCLHQYRDFIKNEDVIDIDLDSDKLKKYQELPIKFFEIGVLNGGSLEIFSKYFTNAELILGCDVDVKCKELHYEQKNVKVIINNEGNMQASVSIEIA